MPVINKFYLLCVIFSGSPDLTLKTCLVYTRHPAPQANTQIIYVNDFQHKIKIYIKIHFVPRRIHLQSSLQRQSGYMYNEQTNTRYKGSNNRGPTDKILQQL